MSRAADLGHSDVETRLRAIAVLRDDHGTPSEAETEALLACLGDARKVVQRRAAEAWAALVARGSPGTARLCAALGSRVARQRWGAAYALGLAGAHTLETLPVLAEVLGSDDGDLRWAAADLLKRGAAAHPALVIGQLAALVRSGLPQQRKMALYVLRDLDAVDDTTTVSVEEALRAAEVDVRLAAVALLARPGANARQAAALLLPLLADPDARLRRAAAAALGNLRQVAADVIAGLERAARADDPGLQRAARRSLRLLRGRQPA